MKIFVIMPFSETTYKDAKHTEEYWNAFYNELCVIVEKNNETIKNMFNDSELKIFRAAAPQGNVVESILWNLVESEIVVAVLTDHNPNVFYELGVRHANANRTIMLCQEGQMIPFDLSNYGVAIYKNDDSRKHEIEQQLLDRFQQVAREPEKLDNPYSQFANGTNFPVGMRKSNITVKVIDQRNGETSSQAHPPKFYRESQIVDVEKFKFTGRTLFVFNIEVMNYTTESVTIVDTELELNISSQKISTNELTRERFVQVRHVQTLIQPNHQNKLTIPSREFYEARAAFVYHQTIPDDITEIPFRVRVQDMFKNWYNSEEYKFVLYTP